LVLSDEPAPLVPENLRIRTAAHPAGQPYLTARVIVSNKYSPKLFHKKPCFL
jgi:hypothetical protein